MNSLLELQKLIQTTTAAAPSEQDANVRPAYEPGVASGSGGNNNSKDNVHNAGHEDAAMVINKETMSAEKQVKDEHLDTNAMAPSKKRRTTAWNFNASKASVVIDLDEDIETCGTRV